MTVQELIDALEKVEDKDLLVYDFTKDLITLVVLEKDLSDGETFVTIKAGMSRCDMVKYVDLIDRKDAIEAVRKAYFDKNIQSARKDPCIVDAVTDWAIRQIKMLPAYVVKEGKNDSRKVNRTFEKN